MGNNELSTITKSSGSIERKLTCPPQLLFLLKFHNGLLPAAKTYLKNIKILRFLLTTLLCFLMKMKESTNTAPSLDDINERIRILEEKSAYQERTIDALNDVIIEQQTQLNSLEEDISRLQTLLTAIEDGPVGGEEPPPPHY